ncbi:MAG: acyl-CoA dehydrogenase family protein [Fidelibacterota bacterium]
MPDFFTDNPDIKFNLLRQDLPELADLLEDKYQDAKQFDYAPENSDDAVENYLNVCELAGGLCANTIAERARQIDEEGNQVKAGDVIYHPLVKANLQDFKRAQLMGISLPRNYGGLNMPQVVKLAVLEMVSRADASLMNLVGLQDIAETINEFGSEEQKEKFIPPLAKGEATGAMVLTEPDAGSDLQAVRLKAIPPTNENNDVWHLNGVKRFITNGNGDILLVQARSEEGTTDARGISLFLCPKSKYVVIRRIENKLGIHGSPTCEMTFNNAPAYLIGRRKMGLIKYVMSLMNGARIGVAAQALGIAEAAYRSALKYARTRIQFGKLIIEIPAVYELLTKMKVNIEAGRLLLYYSGRVVDLFKIPAHRMEIIKKEGGIIDPEWRQKTKYYERLASVLTPFSKYYLAEMCNRVAYDSIQVMGGSGFMKDYEAERYYRDARITSIYEGTSQLQVVGAISGLMSGALNQELDQFSSKSFPDPIRSLSETTAAMIPKLYAAIEFVRAKKDPEITDLAARRLVDMGIDIYISTLIVTAATEDERKIALAELWVKEKALTVEANYNSIVQEQFEIINLHDKILGLENSTC